jgi:hypothetical protein
VERKNKKQLAATKKPTLERYQVYGYYTDEPQVVVDVVDAESDEAAEALVKKARGGDRNGYTPDGAELLSDTLKNLQKVVRQSAEKVAKDLAELAAQYPADDEEIAS